MTFTASTTTATAHRPRRKRPNPFPLILLSPALVALTVLSGYPIARMVVNAFQEYGRAQLMGVPPKWVGIANFTKVLTGTNFPAALGRSLGLMAACVTLTITLGTLVAILMTKLNRFFRLFLSIGLLAAWSIPPMTGTYLWSWIFDTDFGLLNYVLTKLTGHQWLGHQWLLNPLSFYIVLTIIIVWGAIPFVAFTLYAAISGIPGEVLEAASLDQAGPARRFFLIQLPYVRSVYAVLVVLSVIWDLNVFDQVYALQGVGGLVEKTSNLGVWIYQQGTASGSIGTASAAGIIMVILMLAMSIVYVRQSLRDGE
ncbi:MAG: sugar ABC transporter permease [Propionibacteriaceae bacterium]|jgi:N,N'-diacetylchitobiose transport system permease protein|nr:sugar ABC transporter permease [Propionibacteriaceae bacterium]